MEAANNLPMPYFSIIEIPTRKYLMQGKPKNKSAKKNGMSPSKKTSIGNGCI